MGLLGRNPFKQFLIREGGDTVGHRERQWGQLDVLSFSSVSLSHIEKTAALGTHFELQNVVIQQ